MALTGTGSGDGEDGVGETDVKVCVLDGFSDSAEVRSLFASLPEIHEDTAKIESATERFVGESY